jgi:hypothetical protein
MNNGQLQGGADHRRAMGTSAAAWTNKTMLQIARTPNRFGLAGHLAVAEEGEGSGLADEGRKEALEGAGADFLAKQTGADFLAKQTGAESQRGSGRRGLEEHGSSRRMLKETGVGSQRIWPARTKARA